MTNSTHRSFLTVLSDLFRPKWQNSDEKVRLTAVKEITNDKQLAQVLGYELTSGNPADCVIYNAISRLNDKKLLVDIAEKPFRIRADGSWPAYLQHTGNAAEGFQHERSDAACRRLAAILDTDDTNRAFNFFTSIGREARRRVGRHLSYAHSADLMLAIMSSDPDYMVRADVLEWGGQEFIAEIAQSKQQLEIRKTAISLLDPTLEFVSNCLRSISDNPFETDDIRQTALDRLQKLKLDKARYLEAERRRQEAEPKFRGSPYAVWFADRAARERGYTSDD